MFSIIVTSFSVKAACRPMPCTRLYNVVALIPNRRAIRDRLISFDLRLIFCIPATIKFNVRKILSVSNAKRFCTNAPISAAFIIGAIYHRYAAVIYFNLIAFKYPAIRAGCYCMRAITNICSSHGSAIFAVNRSNDF